MKKFLPAILLLICLPALAQDITGIWRGYFNQVEYLFDGNGKRISVPRERYKFEVQLDQRNNRFDGVTYSYLNTIFYGKATAKGTVNIKTRKVFLEELKIVEVRMSGLSDACIMTCFLQYSKSGDEEFLEGTYTSMNIRDSSNCGRGTVFLRRVTTSDFYKEPFLVNREKEKELPPKTDTAQKKVIAKANTTKPPLANNKTAPKTNSTNTIAKKNTNPPKNNTASKTPANNNNAKPEKNIVPKAADIKTAKIDSPKINERKPVPVVVPRVLATRENELVRTITTNAKEITINVYDNGTIDNDTVSVYLDKKLVISKQRLTGKPITLKFQLDDTNDFHELVMVAENLGEIPPNTSLMVVNAGSKQYEVRITSNEQKNAVVIFKYEKDR